MAWYGKGFFYSRYDSPNGSEFSQQNEYHKVFYHKLNTPQADDELIFEQADFPKRYLHAQTSEDENYLFIGISEGTSGGILYFKDLTKEDAEFIKINEDFANDHNFIESIGEDLYFYTNLDAEKYIKS